MYRLLTLQFLVQPAAASNAQSTDEFLKIDGPVLILVKDIEHKIGEFSRITKWKELFVYFAEFSLIELTRGTVCKETLVPVCLCVNKNVPLRLRVKETIAEALSCQLQSAMGEQEKVKNSKLVGRTVSILLEIGELFWCQFTLSFTHRRLGVRLRDGVLP